jgi:murein DD-endopeptidase MepM/ murein hydrolase activator NlpD
VGDTVSQGQVIATMGDTGRVTGVHCDFRIYLNEEAIDPMKVLDAQTDA